MSHVAVILPVHRKVPTRPGGDRVDFRPVDDEAGYPARVERVGIEAAVHLVDPIRQRPCAVAVLATEATLVIPFKSELSAELIPPGTR